MERERKELTKENLIKMINNLDLGQVSEVKFNNYIETILDTPNQLMVEEICTVTIRHYVQIVNKETILNKRKEKEK